MESGNRTNVIPSLLPCPCAEFGGIPMTEENMAEHGWVRERTCHRVRRDTWIWECSLCGSKHGYGALYNYCPNCGAKVVD